MINPFEKSPLGAFFKSQLGARGLNPSGGEPELLPIMRIGGFAGHPAPADGDTFFMAGVNLHLGTPSVVNLTIHNDGPGTLFLTGAPLIVVTGAGAGDYVVSTPTSDTLAPGGTSDFSVTFSPAGCGLKQIFLAIPNNDAGTGGEYNISTTSAGVEITPQWTTATYGPVGTPGVLKITTGPRPSGSCTLGFTSPYNRIALLDRISDVGPSARFQGFTYLPQPVQGFQMVLDISSTGDGCVDPMRIYGTRAGLSLVWEQAPNGNWPGISTPYGVYTFVESNQPGHCNAINPPIVTVGAP